MKSTTRKILVNLFPSSFWQRLFRTSLQLVSSDYLARHGFSSMWWSLNNLKKLGYGPDVIFDVGAFSGDLTLRAMEIFNEAHFYMIEPQPQKQAKLSELERKFKNVTYIPTIAGALDDDEVEFIIQKTGSSVYEQVFEGRTPKQKINLKTKTLDTIAQDKKLSGEFFIKLDVQGYEIEVLKGAKSILSHTNVVLLESSLFNYNLNAPLIDEVIIISFMKNQGFILFDIAEFIRKNDDQVLNQVDLIFCKENWKIRKQVNYI